MERLKLFKIEDRIVEDMFNNSKSLALRYIGSTIKPSAYKEKNISTGTWSAWKNF